jgi:hypothetical protein
VRQVLACMRLEARATAFAAADCGVAMWRRDSGRSLRAARLRDHTRVDIAQQLLMTSRCGCAVAKAASRICKVVVTRLRVGLSDVRLYTAEFGDLWVFDTDSRVWRELAARACVAPRMKHRALLVSVDARRVLLLYGGQSDMRRVDECVVAFDASNESWLAVELRAVKPEQV